MKAKDFVKSLGINDVYYVAVPENVDLSDVEVVQMHRTGDGYVYPDGIYYDRFTERFEEAITV